MSSEKNGAAICFRRPAYAQIKAHWHCPPLGFRSLPLDFARTRQRSRSRHSAQSPTPLGIEISETGFCPLRPPPFAISEAIKTGADTI